MAGKDKPETEIHNTKAHGVVKVTGKARARLIQSSPDADPDLAAISQQVAKETKQKYGDIHIVDHVPPAPLILPDGALALPEH